MNEIDMHDILCPLPTNQDEWCYYVKEQVKRIRRIQEEILKVEDNFQHRIKIEEEYTKYLLQYVENGWAEEAE